MNIGQIDRKLQIRTLSQPYCSIIPTETCIGADCTVGVDFTVGRGGDAVPSLDPERLYHMHICICLHAWQRQRKKERRGKRMREDSIHVPAEQKMLNFYPVVSTRHLHDAGDYLATWCRYPNAQAWKRWLE